VDVNRFNNINASSVSANRGSNRPISSNTWQHNVDHRPGVGYTNPQVKQQYRPSSAGNPAVRDAYRGRGTSGTPGLGPSAQRPAGTGNVQRPSGAGSAQGRVANAPRPNAGGAGTGQGRVADTRRTNAGAASRAPARPQNAQRPSGGAPAFQGVGNGAATRAQSMQGRSSRSTVAQGGGGASRGGGGRAGGGGARGGRR
jgi:hypothetical protein